MATHSPAPDGEAETGASGRIANRNLVWAWIIGLVLLGAIVWGIGRLATGIAPDYRAAGVNAGGAGTRDSDAPSGLPTPPGTAIPPLPPPRVVSTDKTYHYSDDASHSPAPPPNP